jgi:hypothetical protein
MYSILFTLKYSGFSPHILLGIYVFHITLENKHFVSLNCINRFVLKVETLYVLFEVGTEVLNAKQMTFMFLRVNGNIQTFVINRLICAEKVAWLYGESTHHKTTRNNASCTAAVFIYLLFI